MASPAGVDPFSAAGIGIGLFTGVVGVIGGDLFNSAIGAAKITDVKSWIANAVADLENYITDATLQHDLENMRETLSNIQEILGEYASLSPASQHLAVNMNAVVDADNEAPGLVDTALLHPQAIFVATAALGYQLLIRSARYQYDQDAGHIDQLHDKFDGWLTQLCTTRDSISKSLDPASHVAIKCYEFTSPTTGTKSAICSLWVDGIVREGSTCSVPVTTNYSAAETEAQWQVTEGTFEISQSFLDAQNEFLYEVNLSLASAIAAYTAMCKKVGVTYSQPSGVVLPSQPIVLEI